MACLHRGRLPMQIPCFFQPRLLPGGFRHCRGQLLSSGAACCFCHGLRPFGFRCPSQNGRRIGRHLLGASSGARRRLLAAGPGGGRGNPTG